MRRSVHSVGTALAVGLVLTPARADPVPVVIDSVGRVVGPMVGSSNVALTVGGQVVSVLVGPDGLSTQQPYSVRYPDAACTEPGYLEAVALPLPGRVVGTDLVVPGADQKVMTLNYRQDFYGSTPYGTCIAETTTVRVGPSMRIPVDALGLRPPFSVQLR